jgi:AcrR family transcriptional regulator
MPYDNRSRAAAAERTRSRVLAAATVAFTAHGYARTTIRAVAESAGVSQETVYKAFGGKAGLLKAVYDMELAGDTEPVPIGARPVALAVRDAASPAESADAYGRMAAELAGRAGPLLRVVLAARSGDADLEDFAATVDTERLTGAQSAVDNWASRGWLRDGLAVDRARDMLWTLNSPAVWSLLKDRGWSDDDYAAWLAETLLRTVLHE